ncbi:hypothetical protein EN35_35325 [Rhodococcus qingshengii]|nr:hypothetical protein EN35_35325 [Rhodococcus qingshengii]
MNRISRRTILFGLAAAPLGLAVGCGADPAAKSATLAVAGTSRPLPIPPLAESTVDDAGVRHFTLRAGAGTTEIVAGKLTDTWGFNGSILGPTVRAERGESVAFTIDNTLAEPRPSIGTACICPPDTTAARTRPSKPADAGNRRGRSASRRRRSGITHTRTDPPNGTCSAVSPDCS